MPVVPHLCSGVCQVSVETFLVPSLPGSRTACRHDRHRSEPTPTSQPRSTPPYADLERRRLVATLLREYGRPRPAV